MVDTDSICIDKISKILREGNFANENEENPQYVGGHRHYGQLGCRNGRVADETTPTNGADYSVDDAIVDQDLLPKASAEWKQISANDPNLMDSTKLVYTATPEIPTVTVEETDAGALRIKMTKEIDKEKRTWYDAQSDLNLKDVFISGKYLYYDFKAVGQWNINLYLSDEGNAQDNAIKLACYIMGNKYDDSTILYTQGAQGMRKTHLWL